MKPTAKDILLVCLSLEAEILGFEPYLKEVKSEEARQALIETRFSFEKVLALLREEGKKLVEQSYPPEWVDE